MIPKRLHMSNIPFRFKEIDLKMMFEEFGTVLDAEIIFNATTEDRRGLDNDENAKKAKRALDGAEVEGRKIEVNNATKRTLQVKFNNFDRFVKFN